MFNLVSKYGFSLDKDNEKALRCYLLLFYLESYVNGAIIEIRRLSRARDKINKDIRGSLNFGRKKNFHITHLANDTHFYFICIDKVYKLLSSLSDELKDRDIKKLVTELKKTFGINIVRNHLEHIDKRCLEYLTSEDEKQGKRTQISDFGNFLGDYFSFGGEKFPSDIKSAAELKRIYIELLKILEEKYASKDPSFVWRQQSEARYKKIMQMLKKKGLLSF